MDGGEYRNMYGSTWPASNDEYDRNDAVGRASTARNVHDTAYVTDTVSSFSNFC